MAALHIFMGDFPWPNGDLQTRTEEIERERHRRGRGTGRSEKDGIESRKEAIAAG